MEKSRARFFHHMHEKFSLDRIRGLKASHPHPKTVVHPECPAEIVDEADYVGSTAAILEYCGQSEAKEFIVVTESGILVEMRKRFPEKDFIPAPPVHKATRNECNYIKMITLESILAYLESETPEVLLDETIRAAAKRSIDNMISIR